MWCFWICRSSCNCVLTWAWNSLWLSGTCLGSIWLKLWAFYLPLSLSALLNLALGILLAKPRFLKAIDFVLNIYLNIILRVNMNGLKECLPAVSTTMPSEKNDWICTAFFLIFLLKQVVGCPRIKFIVTFILIHASYKGKIFKILENQIFSIQLWWSQQRMYAA